VFIPSPLTFHYCLTDVLNTILLFDITQTLNYQRKLFYHWLQFSSECAKEDGCGFMQRCWADTATWPSVGPRWHINHYYFNLLFKQAVPLKALYGTICIIFGVRVGKYYHEVSKVCKFLLNDPTCFHPRNKIHPKNVKLLEQVATQQSLELGISLEKSVLII
jgi:hypothetical protein